MKVFWKKSDLTWMRNSTKASEADVLRKQRALNKSLFRSSKASSVLPSVLVELNRHSLLFDVSLVSNVLAESTNSRIVPFVASPGIAPWISRQPYRFALAVAFQMNLFQQALLFKSFGARSSPIIPWNPRHVRRKAKEIAVQFFANAPTKTDLENYRIGDVLVGDLVYDTYLRQQNIPTVDLEERKFRNFFEASVGDALFWDQRLRTQPIKAVVASHSSYNLAIPLRFALKYGVAAFVSGEDYLYRLSDDRPFTHMEILDYPEIFAHFNPETRNRVLVESDKLLERRFAGQIYPGADISSSSMQSYRAPEISERLLPATDVPKVLIAPHAFSDAPHGRGHALLPDFWEWLEFLGRKSVDTKYEWFIKNHPDVFRGDRPVIDEFLGRFPHITLIPDNVTHHQLISEGITAVVTVHGTIGFEYALQGVPVINSSAVNPHIRYSFNHHPQTVSELEVLLGNLESLPGPSPEDKQLAREYFAVKTFLAERKFLLTGLPKPVRPAAEGYRPDLHDKSILSRHRQMLLENLHEERCKQIMSEIRDFVLSGEYSITLAGVSNNILRGKLENLQTGDASQFN